MIRKVMIILTMLLAIQLFAEKLPIEVFELPKDAVRIDELKTIDGRTFLNDEPYTGVSYDRYENDKLKEVTTYKKGMLCGPQYEWYETGEKLLSTNYKMGKLNGSYTAWYLNGVYIYNLVFRDGKLNYDTQLSEDDSREETDGDEVELDTEADNEVKGK